jgi:hypothetical protein
VIHIVAGRRWPVTAQGGALKPISIGRLQPRPWDRYRVLRKPFSNIAGGVISPVLANVYLHYVFDLWVQQWRQTWAHGAMAVVRYLDDFIVGAGRDAARPQPDDTLGDRLRRAREQRATSTRTAPIGLVVSPSHPATEPALARRGQNRLPTDVSAPVPPQEEVQAVATGDPSVMSDTATASYYRQQVQVSQSLAADGVTSLALNQLTWGPISVDSTGDDQRWRARAAARGHTDGYAHA